MKVDARRRHVTSLVVLVACVAAVGIGVVLAVLNARPVTEVVPVADLTVDADDRTVWATIYTNSCGEPDRLVLDETEREV